MWVVVVWEGRGSATTGDGVDGIGYPRVLERGVPKLRQEGPVCMLMLASSNPPPVGQFGSLARLSGCSLYTSDVADQSRVVVRYGCVIVEKQK